jgi:hypothetical protein
MRKLTISFMVVSLLCLLNVGALAYAKDLKEHMTFSDDVMVGNTLVKKGDYLVKYDAQTSEVSFVDLKKHKVIATAMATVKVNNKKAESDALYTMKTPAGEKLTGLRLGGQREELIISDTEKITTSDIDDNLVPDVEMIDYELMCLPWL